jgi:hypothetical protein
MICHYWWSQQDGKDKCHWVGWEQMSRAKDAGGLEFRDLHIFNLVMLPHQCWRILQFPNSLCAIVLKAKYFSHTSVLEAKPQAGMSYT